MKTTKISLLILWIIMAFVLYDLCLSLFYFNKFLTPKAILLPIFYSTNFLILFAFILIGIFLFRLIKTYDKVGYFEEKSLRFVKNIAVLLLLIAPLQVFAQTLSDFVIYPNFTPKELLIQFITYFLFRSPSFLFSSLLIFLFLDFMKKAILIKNDNETII